MDFCLALGKYVKVIQILMYVCTYVAIQQFNIIQYSICAISNLHLVKATASLWVICIFIYVSTRYTLAYIHTYLVIVVHLYVHMYVIISSAYYGRTCNCNQFYKCMDIQCHNTYVYTYICSYIWLNTPALMENCILFTKRVFSKTSVITFNTMQAKLFN